MKPGNEAVHENGACFECVYEMEPGNKAVHESGAWCAQELGLKMKLCIRLELVNEAVHESGAWE